MLSVDQIERLRGVSPADAARELMVLGSVRKALLTLHHVDGLMLECFLPLELCITEIEAQLRLIGG